MEEDTQTTATPLEKIPKEDGLQVNNENESNGDESRGAGSPSGGSGSKVEINIDKGRSRSGRRKSPPRKLAHVKPVESSGQAKRADKTGATVSKKRRSNSKGQRKG